MIYVFIYLVIGVIVSFIAYKNSGIESMSVEQYLSCLDIDDNLKDCCRKEPNKLKFLTGVLLTQIVIAWPIFLFKVYSDN
jgi:hypothetical protein